MVGRRVALRFGLRVGFPAVGEEFVQSAVGDGGDAGEHVAEVGEGVEAVAFGALDEAVVDGGGVPAVGCCTSQPFGGAFILQVQLAIPSPCLAVSRWTVPRRRNRFSRADA